MSRAPSLASNALTWRLTEDFGNPRTHAASVNVIDSRSRRGEMSPFVNKKFPKTPGVDFAGTVLAVGSGACKSKVGDAVYGALNPFHGGAFAEVVASDEENIAPKPPSLSDEEAAGLPIAGIAALSSLRDLCQVRAGQRVLIYGSSGGVGLLAIQLAKYFGAHTTTVSGAKGVGLARELGADITRDYGAGPIRLEGRFDAILDYSGKFPFSAARQYLTSKGRFVESSPDIPKFVGSLVGNLFRSQKQLMLTAEPHRRDLEFLSSLVEAGHLEIRAPRVFPMALVKEAFAAQEAGGVNGKIVVKVGSDC